ncbi:hypothetical protein M4D56_01955 [Cytobacillus oceanisediminis]|uniref:hypothetical protein n=1 Tax=Cytobacillus oceanisediminis TaxID=665099 RepID=UPI00203F315D|nr:hypothetical protein [Cytobacillus oceanisediminis]MCM3527859.1 hypothetical protein [Cytobacillus oceanisediminis]
MNFAEHLSRETIQHFNQLRGSSKNQKSKAKAKEAAEETQVKRLGRYRGNQV